MNISNNYLPFAYQVLPTRRNRLILQHFYADIAILTSGQLYVLLSFHLKTQGLFLSVLKLSERFFIEKISWFYHPVITSSQDMTMTLYHSVTELIGRTPLIQLHKLDTGPARCFWKLENQNPGGSIKDRVALSMINEAERTGSYGPAAPLLKPLRGNTGLGLALIAAQKGYSLILVVPDKMSREKIFHLRALGAQVVLTRSDVNKGHRPTTRIMPGGWRTNCQARFILISSITRQSASAPHHYRTGTV